MTFFEAFAYIAAILLLFVLFFLIIYLALRIRQIFLMLQQIPTPALPLEQVENMEGKDPR